ncbi:MAG: hypothetical protein E6J45_13320 [Chloroflexi bacterium]|nr:MAG: hypothetical protein E6J45_13320 [Chloroflexota bacterium]
MGAGGLPIYEIVWTRLLSLQLGHTVAAAGTVLAAFMGGLAAGALVGGRVASRFDRARALRGYAVVELVIGACAVALPFGLRALEPVLALAYGDEPGWSFAVARFGLSLVLVSLPAAAIGATFPLAIRWFVSDASAAGRDAGGLYALNTVGGAVGALATGFVLIPAIGLRATTLVGIALNVAAAGGAWLVANRMSRVVVAPAPSQQPKPRRRTPPRRRAVVHTPATPRWLPAAVLGLSGFVALVYEVAFTRALAIALGPTTYAFAAMLTAFISGLAIGAALASRVGSTESARAFAIGGLMLASAAAAVGTGWFAGTHLPLLIADAVADPVAGASEILTREALYGVGVLLPLSCLFGAIFPMGIALAARSDEAVTHEVSVLYGINTIGGVAGSLAAAFVLVPGVGLQQTLRLAGLLAVGAACLPFVFGRLTARQRGAGIAALVAAGALLFVVPGWDLNLLSSGVYKYAADVRGLNLDLVTALRAGRLLYYKEGAAATVSVRRLAGTIALAIDGKMDASNRTDMLTQKLLAHLPLLLHASPRSVGVIGLGSGVTLGAALSHQIERADVIEISPEVVEASSFFINANNRALEDPRTHLIVGDGRSHLQLTSRRYDVIISEPSNPWMAGVASLFTREFFLAARARLAPGGVICQWAHTYDMRDADLRSIASTFASVFSNGTAWLLGEGDVLFIATNDAEGPRLENIARAWQRPGVAADLAAASVFDIFSLLSLYIAGPGELAHYGQGAFVQTDDRTKLEFSGPLGVYDRASKNAPALQALLDPARVPAAIRTAQASAGAVEWSHRGRMLSQARAYQAAYESFSRSVALDPSNDTALVGLIDAAGTLQQLPAAQHQLCRAGEAVGRSGCVCRGCRACAGRGGSRTGESS